MAQPHVSFNNALLKVTHRYHDVVYESMGYPLLPRVLYGECLLVFERHDCMCFFFGVMFHLLSSYFVWPGIFYCLKMFLWLDHSCGFCSYVVFSFFVFHSLYFLLCISFLIMSPTRYALLVAFSYEFLLSFPSTNVLDNLDNLGNVLDN